jgi:hypothetical protein
MEGFGVESAESGGVVLLDGALVLTSDPSTPKFRRGKRSPDAGVARH